MLHKQNAPTIWLILFETYLNPIRHRDISTFATFRSSAYVHLVFLVFSATQNKYTKYSAIKAKIHTENDVTWCSLSVTSQSCLKYPKSFKFRVSVISCLEIAIDVMQRQHNATRCTRHCIVRTNLFRVYEYIENVQRWGSF